MDAFTWLLLVVIVVVVPLLALSLRKLSSIDNRLQRLEVQPEHGEHDSLAPVFSTLQVRRARSRFAAAYRGQLELQETLYESSQWIAREGKKSKTAPSPELLKQMRQICEALVEAECAWKEYVFMVDGNVRAAHQGEPGRKIVSEWETLLKSSRGEASRDVPTPNFVKLHRVEEWLNNWVARMSQPTTGGKTELLDDELFRDIWEDRAQWRESVWVEHNRRLTAR
jgi:hypothetical protein